MSEYDLKKMTEEDKKLFNEFYAGYRNEGMPKIDDLLGFKLSEARCFIPFIHCGRLPTHTLSLIPMYETVILPIHPVYAPGKGQELRKVKDDLTFKNLFGLTPSEMATLAEKGRVLPYFSQEYEGYHEKTIRPLLQPGVPRMSPRTMSFVRTVASEIVTQHKDLGHLEKLAMEDIKNLIAGAPKQTQLEPKCSSCLSTCYALGMRKYFQDMRFGRPEACFISYAVSVHYLDAVLQAECPFASAVLGNVGRLPEGIDIEYILKGLKVAYAPYLPLEDYVDVFDGKTSKALRVILANILSDPLSRRYSERLSAKIYDLNRQVEEIAKSRAAKLLVTISDMALYGGKKFIESQAQRYVKIPEKHFVKLGEWLASKGIDLTAKFQRKDWSIAQLYKVRCKLRRCK